MLALIQLAGVRFRVRPGQRRRADLGVGLLAGGMGGFLLPIMFGMLEDFTGIRSTSFMLLYGTVCVSLIWMHFSFKAKRKEIEHA